MTQGAKPTHLVPVGHLVIWPPEQKVEMLWHAYSPPGQPPKVAVPTHGALPMQRVPAGQANSSPPWQ